MRFPKIDKKYIKFIRDNCKIMTNKEMALKLTKITGKLVTPEDVMEEKQHGGWTHQKKHKFKTRKKNP